MGEDITLRFEPNQLTPEGQRAVQEMRDAFKALVRVLEKNLNPGRQSALVYTKLEEAAMWATKSVSHG